MSKNTKHDSSARGAVSVEDRLARLLEAPSLARVVPHLPPETLHRLIRSRGLDACSELVASATPAQLVSLLDLDLWHARPGRDEQFDVERFGEWLEVLVDGGSSVAARTVAALDKDVVIEGLSRYVRVFDPGIFEPTAQSDDELTDRHEAMREGDSLAAGEPLEYEVGGYLVRARRADGWDAVVTLLEALDAEHSSCFHAVMRGCRSLSNSTPEIDGLDDLLLAPEQHLHDVASERERRRSQRGYATAADARAFLQMARQPGFAGSTRRSIAENPMVAAYFRAADESLELPDDGRPAGDGPEPSTLEAPASLLPGASAANGREAPRIEDPESLEAVFELLAEAGLMPARPRALLDAPETDPQAARQAGLRRLLAYVRETDDTAYFARTRELAFLANTLLAACSLQSRPFTPQEASDAAAAVCNLGLEYWPARWRAVPVPGPTAASSLDTAAPTEAGPCPPDPFLIDHDLVTAFEVGWSVLYKDVCLFAAEQLIAMLTDVECLDRDIERGLVAFRRRLLKEREAGTPWRARPAAEILAMLDPTAWVSVLGLLDECPVLPDALTAIVESRTKAVSPSAFDFISTAAQIDDVRQFMRRLPDVLSR